ncbi:g6721 [Coccomyxa viridis]|uniref:G6721 protein n=1 Tax=Coccomyxa viridis TaxID=1274662 RepID=A0ABP1FW16_9CHLO
MSNLGASSSVASATAGTALVPCYCWKRSAVFQPARPQHQHFRQHGGRECAPVQCNAAADSASEHHSLSRRAAIGGGLALAAAAANLQAALPASARQVVSSDWEKVDLPVDPGVVLLDIGFTDDKHGFLLGTRETLLETKDGGRTWTQRSIEAAKDEGFNYRFNSISFNGNEGWICGKPAILLHTTDAGENWERVPLSAKLPGNPILVVALPGEQGRVEMTTDAGAVYVTKNAAYSWQAAVQESVDATLNRTVSSGISGASYYEGSFSNIQRSPAGDYVAVSSRGNFFLTWSPGQTYWQPHNRPTARRVQNMGWTPSNTLWLATRGGDVYLSSEEGVSDKFDQAKLGSRGFGILDVGFKNNSKEGYAVGGSGTLLKTEDNGQSWKRDRSTDGVAGNLYAVKFTPSGNGFILGNDGILLRYIA